MLMKFRLGLSVGVLAGMAGLYAMSQAAALRGPEAARDYAVWVDAPWVRLLAAAVLLSAVVLAFIPSREDGDPPN